jgi:hypothetical protein
MLRNSLFIGMTAVILIFSWVNNEISYDNYHPQADRIYRITSHLTRAKWTWETSPLILSRYAGAQLPEVESIAALRPIYYTANSTREMGWGQFDYQCYLKLRPGARPEKVAATITTVFRQNTSSSIDKEYLMTLTPLKDIHFEKKTE